MPDSRSIPQAAWEQARQRLVFYFSRRHGLDAAEDLAQETLEAVWRRSDFEFACETDFLKVCYGFARNVARQNARDRWRQDGIELDPEIGKSENPVQGLNPVELGVYANQVVDLAKSRLSQADFEMLDKSEGENRQALADQMSLGSANNARVHLHRVRKKLATWAGWGKGKGKL